MKHPGKDLIEEIRARSLTQKEFSLLLGKKVSELNELIKGKRNITIQWDILLSQALGTPEKYWIYKQIDYDYIIAKKHLEVESKSSPKKIDKNIVTETTKTDQVDKKSNEIKEEYSTDNLNLQEEKDHLKEDNKDIEKKTLQDKDQYTEILVDTNNLHRKKLEQKFMNF